MVPKSDKGKLGFSAREARALLWLLPVLAVASWLVWEITRPDVTVGSGESPETEIRDTAASSRDGDGVEIEAAPSADTGLLRTSDPRNDDAGDPPAALLFHFDPNTIEFHDLVRLGFTRSEALGVIKYRERGKVFEIPEDFAACYQVSEEMYLRLAPYICIGEEYRLKKFERSASPEPRISHQSDADVALIEVRGDMDSTNSTALSTRRESAAGAPLLREILIDLNTADSAALISVSGIGERTVVSIMEYRQRLGGFADVRQLAEVRGVTEQNYERMIEQIYVDSAVIQKIDINFAPAKSLAAHPYIRAEALRKLLRQRQLKGGWRTVEELEQDNIFTKEELAKLGPYLVFN